MNIRFAYVDVALLDVIISSANSEIHNNNLGDNRFAVPTTKAQSPFSLDQP